MWWCDEVVVCLYGHSQCHILLELEDECGLRVGCREGRRGEECSGDGKQERAGRGGEWKRKGTEGIGRGKGRKGKSGSRIPSHQAHIYIK